MKEVILIKNGELALIFNICFQNKTNEQKIMFSMRNRL